MFVLIEILFIFINEFYADYISDPNSLPEGWRKFFDGLSENEKLILDDLNGPSWSPEKKIKKINLLQPETKEINSEPSDINGTQIKQASQDSVRAIMLIRAFRIRGHLISNLDPLNLQEKREHSELNQKRMVLQKKITIEKFF